MYFKQQVIILSPEFKDINDGFPMNFHRTKKDGFPWSLGTNLKIVLNGIWNPRVWFLEHEATRSMLITFAWMGKQLL